MNKALLISGMMILLFADSVATEELHIWVDTKGVTNITNKTPANPAKVIGREAYQAESPAAIEQYEANRKRLQQQSEADQKQKQIIEDSKRRLDAYSERENDLDRQKALARQKRDAEKAEDYEAEKARLRALENKDYNEARRLRLKHDQLKIDRKMQD
jgi:preprotein translocase subunit SecF